MLKGPTTNLAFLTQVLGSDGEARRDLTEEGRLRAAEIGLRKYRGDPQQHVFLKPAAADTAAAAAAPCWAMPRSESSQPHRAKR